MSHQLLPTVSLTEGVRRLGGFFVGLLIVLPLGWGLVFLAYSVLAPRLGVSPTTAGMVAAAVSLVLFQVLERGHRLTRLMGFEPTDDTPPWVTATLIWVLGPLWMLHEVGNYGQEPLLRKLNQLKQPQTKKKVKDPHRDHLRESIETLVFVITAVLLLKTFVVEAFVIPTGSMAETLYGYKKVITCPECGHTFAVNASREAEPQPGTARNSTSGYCCPNCRYENKKGAVDVGWTSGDRVLVGKFLGIDDRNRVVVFKYPDTPQSGQVAQNYIKRLVGFGGETVALYQGDLYVTRALDYDPLARDERNEPLFPRPEQGTDLWRTPFADPYGHQRWGGPDFRYSNAAHALELFRSGQASGFADPAAFQIVRKSNDLVLEMMRLVFDNDHQAKSLIQAGAPPRWFPGRDGAGWTPDDPKAPKVFTHSGEQIGWVRYRHMLPKDTQDDQNPGWSSPPVALEPQLITNFLGYNAGFEATPTPFGLVQPIQTNLSGSNEWVGDLILEAAVTVADPAAKFVFELSKGPNRFQAEFAGGKVKLVRTGPGGGELATRDTPVTKAGTYAVRFANVDCRLRVWVNDTVVDFGNDADYASPPPPEGDKPVWTDKNDILEPASIGASGGVTVSELKLWRDTYYTNAKGPIDTYYVQPGHYLCMGDNSSQSSDGRAWGLVPERLMLGRAVFIFFPLNRIGFIK